jgi:hypothetical protein
VRPPAIDPFWLGRQGDLTDPANVQVVTEVMDEVAAEAPEDAVVLDLRGWMQSVGWEDDQALRPDGVHFTPEAATLVTETWLGPQLVRIAARVV